MEIGLCRALYVRIKSFVFVQNTVRSYWNFLRDLEVVGEGQAHLPYAKMILILILILIIII